MHKAQNSKKSDGTRIIELSLPSQEQLDDNYKIQLKPPHKTNLDLGLGRPWFNKTAFSV